MPLFGSASIKSHPLQEMHYCSRFPSVTSEGEMGAIKYTNDKPQDFFVFFRRGQIFAQFQSKIIKSEGVAWLLPLEGISSKKVSKQIELYIRSFTCEKFYSSDYLQSFIFIYEWICLNEKWSFFRPHSVVCPSIRVHCFPPALCDLLQITLTPL